ncbi:MAG: histidine phosphatase family protein [Rhizobiales bacterium]|nr:histidine phosphatase family protein [Hyphomicrobiales bacterium]
MAIKQAVRVHEPTIAFAHRLYFLRHGETSWNLEHRLQGKTDIELNETGRAQARRHAGVMKELDEDWTAFTFWVSPMIRARQTFEIVREELGIEVEPHFDQRLREGSFGRWEGLTWQDVIERERENHDIWVADCWDRAPHGGDTYGDLADRLIDWSKDVIGPSVVIAHGGISRSLRTVYQGLERKNLASLKVTQRKFMRLEGGEVEFL